MTVCTRLTEPCTTLRCLVHVRVLEEHIHDFCVTFGTSVDESLAALGSRIHSLVLVKSLDNLCVTVLGCRPYGIVVLVCRINLRIFKKLAHRISLTLSSRLSQKFIVIRRNILPAFHKSLHG